MTFTSGHAVRIILLVCAATAVGAVSWGQQSTPPVQTFTVRRPAAIQARDRRPSRVTSRPDYQPLKFRHFELSPPDPTVVRRAEQDSAQDDFRRANVGVHRVVSWTIQDAQWEYTGSEWRARLSITSQTAFGLRLHLSNVVLPDGARLFIYTPDEKQPAMSFTAADFSRPDFWSQILVGDTALLELFVPVSSTEPPPVSLTVAEVSHFFVSLTGFGTPSTCEVDASCYSAWDGVGDSVGLIYASSSGTTFVCSGSLLNDLANDYAPMFLTARHCFSDSLTAESAVVFWRYKSSSCNGSVPDPSTVPQTLGAELLSMSTNADATLLLLTGDLPTDIAYAGWTTTELSYFTPATVLHHPKASFRRYAQGHRDADISQYPNDYAFYWTTGLVEPGSSGSPGFNSAQQVIGHLSRGSSQCGVSNGPDLLGKFFVAYPDLNLTGKGDILVKGLPDDQYAPNFTQATAASVSVPLAASTLVLRHFDGNTSPDWFAVSIPANTQVSITAAAVQSSSSVSLAAYNNGYTFTFSSPLTYRTGDTPEIKYISVTGGAGFIPYNFGIDIVQPTLPSVPDLSVAVTYSNGAEIIADVTAGGAPATYATEYSTDPNFGSYSTYPGGSILVSTGFNQGGGAIWGGVFVLGLQPSITYYARIAVTNSVGTARSTVVTFTTAADLYPPRFSVSSLTFPDTMVGSSAYTQQIYVVGGSRYVNTLDNVTVTPPFYIDLYSCPGFTNCWINVGFKPTADANFSGTLSANAQGVPVSIPLYGNGRISSILSVRMIDWINNGNVWLGSIHSGHVQLSNTGIAPMVITGITTSNASASTDCPASITPGSSCILTTTFTATMTGSFSGSVTVTTNGTICCSNLYSQYFSVNVIDLVLLLTRPVRPVRNFAADLPLSPATLPPSPSPSSPAVTTTPLFAVPGTSPCSRQDADAPHSQRSDPSPDSEVRRNCVIPGEQNVIHR